MNAQKRYVPAVGPRLKKLLLLVMGMFSLLAVNATYLGAITLLEWQTGRTYQNYFYMWMFIIHLGLGLAFVAPMIVFGLAHLRYARNRPNRRAVRVGYALFTTSLVLLASGLVLTRLGAFEVRDPTIRGVSYWLHVVSPLAIAWLFVLHRLAGKRIRWRVGMIWAAVAVVFATAMALLHSQDPRAWNQSGPEEGEQYFFPSLARTATGGFIPAATLMMDSYCKECHSDIHAGWEHSVHRFSSFNNPAYLASVRETRRVALERDGDVRASRFCAGCHDPVPFFSGAFDDPDFDDVGHPTAQAGITCTACHAITNVNSPRGNSDFTIEEPIHYPFARSESPTLAWLGRQLVKAKPELHKKTFLKPLHKSPLFCGTCHKVHLPEELNHYRWLRGQNHYDSFLLSGVSGHGVASFYYPSRAEENCNGCHMPPLPSDDFGARDLDGQPGLEVHGHQFPSANTAIPHLLGLPESVNQAHRDFLEGVMRVDIVGLRAGGSIGGDLTAPLRPITPALEPGKEYLLEVVIRTVKMGHHFTQGTADSNEIWLEVTASGEHGVIGRSGDRDEHGEVDPWSHFVNAYVLDRDGRRIDRRNAQDIFVSLYNHQIPPGAAQVVHYRIEVPEDAEDYVNVKMALHYRKFDTTYMRFFQGEEFDGNDLPIVTLAHDELIFPVARSGLVAVNADSATLAWERWNDYGIGLLREGALRQAAEAFAQVEALGRAEGAVNQARVFLEEGRLDDAADALTRAAACDPPASDWVLAWWSGLVDRQNGNFDAAIERFEALARMDTAETRERGFDFSKDYRLLIELGRTLFEHGEPARARDNLQAALVLDPENAAAHFNLALVLAELEDESGARRHRELHQKYKVDDNARDRAILAARRASAAADHAAESVVIYGLQKEQGR